MTAKTDKPYVLNPPDYKKAIANEIDFYIQFHSLHNGTEAAIVRMIYRFLQNYDILYMKNPVITVVRELVNNAIKANLKRVYFKKKNLNISSPEEYRAGMEQFKEDVYQSDSSEYFQLLEKSNLVTRVAFKATDDNLFINVINNIPILEAELEKITNRVKKAYEYNDIAEAFDDVLDDTEGAGLGLIIAMMLFKNSGLPAESFRIYQKNDLTIAAISIPQSLSVIKSRIRVAEEILNEVETIPAFPESILEIQRLCSNPEVPMKRIAESITHDPGLTTSMLRLANSAGYVTGKKIESIEEAAKIVGVRGINTLLLATGVHKIMDSRYKRYEAVWQESYRRAFYAQKIALQMKQSKLSEFAYLASLVADIGLIVILSIKPELGKRLMTITGQRSYVDSQLIEEISIGISHATLGGMICRKWNFNDSLIKAVEYHHRPHMAPDTLRPLVNVIHLADSLCETEKNSTSIELIDEDVLEFFNLNESTSFDLLHKVLMQTYEVQKNRFELSES